MNIGGDNRGWALSTGGGEPSEKPPRLLLVKTLRVLSAKLARNVLAPSRFEGGRAGIFLDLTCFIPATGKTSRAPVLVLRCKMHCLPANMSRFYNNVAFLQCPVIADRLLCMGERVKILPATETRSYTDSWPISIQKVTVQVS